MKLHWNRGTEFLVFLLLIGFTLLPIILELDGVPFHPNAAYTDLLTSHWPNATFLRTELSNRGEFPLWNPLILSGAPLVADPLFGIWYPPNWLTVLIPVTIAINILFILHLVWAGLGTFKFLQAEGTSRAAAIVAGVAFGATPKLIGHIGLGHLGLISAVAWTPWVLLCVRHTLARVFETRERVLAWSALTGGVVGITFLADPRWLIPLAIFTAAYAVHLLIRMGRIGEVIQAKSLYSLLMFSVTAMGISAGLSIPLAEFLRESTRAKISVETAADISLPFSNILKFVIPDFGGWPETLPYVGTIILGLALIGVLSKSSGWKFWLSVGFGALILALGDHAPVYSLIAKITPGLKFIRVPARFLFISSFSLAVLAGLGIESLFGEGGKRLRESRLGVVGYGAIVIIFGIAIMLMDLNRSHAGSYMIISSSAFILLFFLSTSDRWIANGKMILWIIAIAAELAIFGGSVLKIQPKEVAFQENQQLVELIDGGADLQRVFSTSYSIPQHIAAKNSLQLADGINPLQINSYTTYMAEAVGFPDDDYSVTLPPFPDGDPSTPQPFELDAEKLGFLNIAYILSEYQVNGSGLRLVGSAGSTYMYENLEARPRAWIETGEGESSQWREVDSIRWSPNEIEIRATGPGLLVLSEVAFPGWIASVDDQGTPIVNYQEIFRAVSLEAGDHHITVRYRPMWVYVGAGITILATIVLGWAWVKR